MADGPTLWSPKGLHLGFKEAGECPTNESGLQIVQDVAGRPEDGVVCEGPNLSSEVSRFRWNVKINADKGTGDSLHKEFSDAEDVGLCVFHERLRRWRWINPTSGDS